MTLLQELKRLDKHIKAKEEHFRETMKLAEDRRQAVYEQLKQYIIDNKCYLPVERLIDYTGERIYKVECICRNDEGKVYISCSWGLEDCIIDSLGKINSAWHTWLKNNEYTASDGETSMWFEILGFFNLHLKGEEAIRPETSLERLWKC